MKYERIAIKREAPLVTTVWEATKLYNRLVALEDKIENGELISTVQDEQSEQETAFFAKHDVKVCGEVVKECLQVLRDTRIARICDDYSWGWDSGIDQAIERLIERYNIDEKEGKGE